jgi:LysM repeat protein
MRHLIMNNQSPLVPQSSFLEQKNKGRARVKIAVFVVLAIHGIGLMALLMQGCQKPPEPPPAAPEQTNATPAFVEPTNAPPAPSAETNAAVAPAAATTPTSSPTSVEPVVPSAAPTGATEYTVAKGDSFSSLAKKFHVSAKAIADANPGVDSAKLKIGQKLHIPAASSVPAAAGAGAAVTGPASAGGEQTYTVKSGDNLITIAKEKGISVKALRAANGLKTDRIHVGQKLKIPAKASTSAAGSTTPTEPASGSSTGASPASPTTR